RWFKLFCFAYEINILLSLVLLNCGRESGVFFPGYNTPFLSKDFSRNISDFELVRRWAGLFRIASICLLVLKHELSQWCFIKFSGLISYPYLCHPLKYVFFGFTSVISTNFQQSKQIAILQL